MSHPDLCYQCKNLERRGKKTNVVRKSDGQNEWAVWYSCKVLGLPLPTISCKNVKFCNGFEDAKDVGAE